ERLKAFAERFTELNGAGKQAAFFYGFNCSQSGAAGDRMAAERRRVRTRDEFVRELRAGKKAAARHAAGERLGERHRIRLDFPVLTRVPLARASHAGLHFIEDQHELVLVGQFPQARQVVFGRNVDAALALNRLHENGAGLAVDQLSGSVEIAERRVTEPGKKRLQALVVLRLARRTEGAERAAVEAVDHRDDLVASRLAVEPGELDDRFVRFGAAVA